MKEPDLPVPKSSLIDALLANRISLPGLATLREVVNEHELSLIIQKIYDLNRSQVNKIAALESMLAKIDGIKNSQRNGRFEKILKNGFRKDKNNKVILAEGDSWFNYPVILSDVLDWIGMERNMAVYSLAEGGDWLLNMLSARKYVEQLSVIHPDVFLISAGGNDLVGRSRLAAMVQPEPTSQEQEHSEWAKLLISIARNRSVPIAEYKSERFERGIKYISKDFYALLMFFHLQYYFLINGILRGGNDDAKAGKFPGMQIITQGYDYAIPNDQKKWGFNPLRWYRPVIRTFLGHGSWLKTPLELRGIYDQAVQSDIIYAMIYLFNEMMIYTGDIFCQIPGLENRVFHIDSRGSVGQDGWSDELHPLPAYFKQTAQAFIDCINQTGSAHGQVYVVKPLKPNLS